MSNKVQLALFGIIGFGILVFLDIFVLHATFVNPILPENISEPSTRIYMPSECMVEVSNYLPDGHRSYGKGVVVERNGEIFVLTSSMIFTYMGEITVDYGNVRYTAKIIDDAEIWGLTALECSFMEGTRTTKINDYPNHPPGTQVMVGNWGEVNTLEYMNDDWVLLDGSLPASATGMPTENAGELVGIIVGLNRANQKQAIMVGNRALKEFCDQVAPDAPPAVYTPKGPSWY